jgi:hypothetical protein
MLEGRAGSVAPVSEPMAQKRIRLRLATVGCVHALLLSVAILDFYQKDCRTILYKACFVVLEFQPHHSRPYFLGFRFARPCEFYVFEPGCNRLRKVTSIHALFKVSHWDLSGDDFATSGQYH